MDADEPISVTVDATDLTGASAEPLKAIIARYGRPISARAFADFQQTSLAELAVQLYQLGFTLVHCPTWPNGDGFPKPIVRDILAQDLRDQLEELEGVETFLLVATSREFIAVANAMRRHEKRVILVAEESKVSRELRLCADEFVVLPPSKSERPAATRTTRTTATRTTSARQDRVAEPVRTEPLRAEPVKVEPVKVEPPQPVARVERAPEPVKVDRTPAEPVRAEPVREAAKAESQELRLPTDNEVVAEVRRIIAAEGICTPRRLARALCPVDRTPTGELRSRIANRIQSLTDSGKLLREKLVVGGTSVETIIVGEDRDGHQAHEQSESAVVQQAPVEAPAGVDEAPEKVVPSVGNGFDHVVTFGEAEASASEPAENAASPSARDLDAFVESVLRSSETPVALPQPAESSDAPVEEPVGAEADASAQEAPAKRTRSRRRSPAKKTTAGEKKDKAPAAEPEAAS